MILHKGTAYWSVGITVRWRENSGGDASGSRSGWDAWADFYDDGFCDDDADAGRVSTQGRLATRYAVSDGTTVAGLTAAIDALLVDAQKLGVEFRGVADGPTLYYDSDGRRPEYPPPPGWRQTLAAEAKRIGWRTPRSAD